jgi:hypothetical protein
MPQPAYVVLDACSRISIPETSPTIVQRMGGAGTDRTGAFKVSLLEVSRKLQIMASFPPHASLSLEREYVEGKVEEKTLRTPNL